METRLCELADSYNSEYLGSLDINPCEKFAAGQSLSGDATFTRQYLIDLLSGIEELVNEENNSNLQNAFAEVEELINTEQDLQSYINETFGKTINFEKSRDRSKVCITRSNQLISIAVKPQDSPNLDSSRPINSNSKTSKPQEFLSPRECDFDIIKLISQGAYSAVFLVRYSLSDRLFAMKKIHKSHAVLKNQVRQIFAERDILSFTDNPFVISMFCSFETENAYCMVMEYAEGGDCASLLKSVGILPTELVRTYIAETLVAVEYIHNYGIIHRDIKPDNLLITSLGHIKLTDFGLSKVGLMNLTTLNSKEFFGNFQDNKIQGTPNYIAPEVILNKPYSRAVDYWSLGIVLYEFLVGCTPFLGHTADKVFEAIVYAPIEWPQDDEAIDPDAQDLIQKLLNRDPQLRIGSDNTSCVKFHKFFDDVNWNDLVHLKIQPISFSLNEEDTSKFDSRIDRYQHYRLFRSESPSVNHSDSSFDSYTKLFKDVSSTIEPKRKPVVSSDTQTQPLDTSNESLSIFLPTGENSVSSSSFPLHSSVLTFKMNKTLISGQFGFTFTTQRVFLTKNLSFIIHLVKHVREGSSANSVNLKPGLIILSINNTFLVGKQHVDVVKILLSINTCTLVAAYPDSLEIKSRRYYPSIYTLDSHSDFFKQLVKQNTVFEKRANFNFYPVLLNTSCQITQLLSHRNIDDQTKVKKNKTNIIKSYLKKFIEKRSDDNFNIKSNFAYSSTPIIRSKKNSIKETQSPNTDDTSQKFRNSLTDPLPKTEDITFNNVDSTKKNKTQLQKIPSRSILSDIFRDKRKHKTS